MGRQLAPGYLNRPSLSSVRFVANPFVPGERLYRSGDLARWNSEGSLEYLQRADTQVQLRGFRVELGEIESVLVDAPGVAGAVVAVQHGPAGDVLVGHIVPETGTRREDPEGDDLRESVLRYAAARLPGYMVPSRLAELAALPLTVNGKLDRTALPPIEVDVSRTYTPPSTPTERAITEAMADVLGLERVGADDNFFELGGNSLAATRLARAVGETLGRDVAVRLLFVASDARSLAARLESDADAAHAGFEMMLPLSSGSGTPVFFIHPIIGLAWSYAGFTRHLPPDTPMYGIQSPAITEDGALASSIGELADRYLAEILRVAPDGPYRLVGWSLGGVIAQAVATRLERAGRAVSLLALLDSRPRTDVGTSGVDTPDTAAADILGGIGIDVAAATGDADDLDGLVALIAEAPGVAGVATPDLVRSMVSAALHNGDLLTRHEPDVYGGDMLFFAASGDDATGTVFADAWKDYTRGRITSTAVPVTHWEMASDEAIAVIGPALRDALDD